MKTIEFQKNDSIKNNVTVSVNGRLYTISNQSLAITVTDDKPLKVKIRNTFSYWGSKKYTFEPKDSMTLQISENRRLTKRYQAMTITAMVFFLALVVIACYFEKLSWFILAQSIIFSIYPVYVVII